MADGTHVGSIHRRAGLSAAQRDLYAADEIVAQSVNADFLAEVIESECHVSSRRRRRIDARLHREPKAADAQRRPIQPAHPERS
jgi:hypothetical protein